MTKHYFSYLALGDSYTIGECVSLRESFPYQTVQLLRKQGIHFHAPEIVAQTGWTTVELAEHLLHTALNESYDFVTLLIGVNNQYRGLPVEDYQNDFEFLLKKALQFTANRPEHVIVLSIPDWSVTPFAAEKNITDISTEIDAFNELNKNVSEKYNVHYLSVTKTSREAKNDASLIAKDGLHPSEKEYQKWAYYLTDYLKQTIERGDKNSFQPGIVLR